jgi:hypothetical protein
VLRQPCGPRRGVSPNRMPCGGGLGGTCWRRRLGLPDAPTRAVIRAQDNGNCGRPSSPSAWRPIQHETAQRRHVLDPAALSSSRDHVPAASAERLP